jgi:exosortase H (IPTLxxWG-CTERM-specific)
MARFIAVFVGLLSVLFLLELTPPAQQYLVLPWTALVAKASALLITAFDANVIATGKVLRDGVSGFGVSIEAGCNGVEAMIILIAAMVAFPAPWRYRALGFAAGLVAVQAANLLRIVTLFYLGQWHMGVFRFAHEYVWQALIMLDVLIVWLVWLKHIPGGPLRPARAA